MRSDRFRFGRFFVPRETFFDVLAKGSLTPLPHFCLLVRAKAYFLWKTGAKVRSTEAAGQRHAR